MLVWPVVSYIVSALLPLRTMAQWRVTSHMHELWNNSCKYSLLCPYFSLCKLACSVQSLLAPVYKMYVLLHSVLFELTQLFRSEQRTLDTSPNNVRKFSCIFSFAGSVFFAYRRRPLLSHFIPPLAFDGRRLLDQGRRRRRYHSQRTSFQLTFSLANVGQLEETKRLSIFIHC